MNIRIKTAAIIAGLCAAAVPFAVANHVARGGEYQPIIVTTVDDFTAGTAIPVQVLTQGPADVTIYSDPPSAVSGDGYIDGTSGTIQSSTSTDATGDVTVYAVTDGETNVSTETATYTVDEAP